MHDVILANGRSWRGDQARARTRSWNDGLFDVVDRGRRQARSRPDHGAEALQRPARLRTRRSTSSAAAPWRSTLRCRFRSRSRASRWARLAHLDLDAFFAAVELHRRPELRGTPLVVGGDPRGRGVVSTASYEARKYGIRSAMSCAEALRRCPQAVFVRPDHAAYREWSRRVWDTMRAHAPVVERIGIDEGYLVLADGDPPGAGGDRAAGDPRRGAAVRIAGRRRLQGGVQDRLGHEEAGRDHVRAGRPGGGVPGAAGRRGGCPGWGRRANSGLTALGIETIGALAALHDEQMRSSLPGRGWLELRDGARRDRPAPGVIGARRGDLDLERGDVPAASRPQYARSSDDRVLPVAVAERHRSPAGSSWSGGWRSRFSGS